MMKQFEPQLKKTIRDLIDSGNLNEAESMINRYGLVHKEDPEIYCMRADIAEKAGRAEEMEMILKEGHDIDANSPDLLYRLGTLFQKKNLKDGAIYFYSRFLKNSLSEELKDRAKQSILELEGGRGEEDGEIPVSIAVIDCGNPDFIMNCIDSLYKNTADTRYELITVYTGTGGGVKDFFDSLPNKKKLDIRGNLSKAILESLKAAAGKFTAILQDSVIVTHNWLENLQKCLDSDDKTGMAVPVSGGAGYYPHPDTSSWSIYEAQEFAREHNISNPELWEIKLSHFFKCMLVRTGALRDCIMNDGSRDIYGTDSFIESDLGFLLRRAGYKLFYVKDTFIHLQELTDSAPDCSVSSKTERDRRVFLWKFGVDPWEDTVPSQDIINSIDYNRNTDIRILGINPRCGSTLIEVKNNFRSRGIHDIKIYALSEDKRYMDDLNSVCDHAVNTAIESLPSLYGGNSFDIIFSEGPLGQSGDIYKDLKILKEILKADGQLILFLDNSSYYLNIYNMINNVETEHKPPIINKRSLVNDIKCAGFDEINVSALKLNISEEYGQFFKGLSDIAGHIDEDGQDDIFRIKRYVFSMKGKSELKNILIYPGFDNLLEDRFFEGSSEENSKVYSKGKIEGEVLKGVFKEKGYNLMTIDRRHFREAEYIIFKDVPKNPDNYFFKDYYHYLYRGSQFFKECIDMSLQDRMVLIINEPPGVMPENYDRKIHDFFKIIFTWDDDMVDNRKYYKYNRPQPSGISRNFARSFKNRKLCTALLSNNYINETGELYSERLRAIKYFEEEHPDKLDFYGKGWDRRQFRCFKGVADNKMELLGRYKFCLAYESSSKYKGNITEKLFDCLISGCVPIYLGAPNISDYIPQSTFIDMRRFKNYDELYEFINSMPEARFNKYLESINNFLHSHRYYKFTDIYFAENIANILSSGMQQGV